MRVLRGCKMIGLDTYGGKSRVLLGFFLLASCVPLVRTIDYLNLDATTSELMVGDRLVSSPNPYFELENFANDYSVPHSNGILELSDVDQNQNIQWDNIQWYTVTDDMDVVSAQLLDSEKLVLKNINGTKKWNSFDDSLPTDTLLPGQGMHRSQGHSLISWQKNGNPEIANDTYSFGWDARRVLTLSWSRPKIFFKGGRYNGSKLSTSILSGRPDPVSNTTLKRITTSRDGGLRTMQYAINQTVTFRCWFKVAQTSNQHRKVVANWVVSDRPGRQAVALRGADRILHLRNQTVEEPPKETGALYNLGYPTEALHGTDRTSYSRNQTVLESPTSWVAKKDNKWVKILVPAVGIPGLILLIGVAIFCLWRYKKVWQCLRACSRCGPCCRRPKPRYEIKFPGDMPERTEPGDGGVELKVEEREPALRCTIQCHMSCKSFW